MEGVKGTITRSPAPENGPTKDTGYTDSSYMEQPFDPDMDFSDGEAWIAGWHKDKRNWFKRTWSNIKWWWITRNASWRKDSDAGNWRKMKPTKPRNPFPDVAIVLTTENGTSIVDAGTGEIYSETGVRDAD